MWTRPLVFFRTLPLGSIHLISIFLCTWLAGAAAVAVVTVVDVADAADVVLPSVVVMVGVVGVGGGSVRQKTIKESLTKCDVGGAKGVSWIR